MKLRLHDMPGFKSGLSLVEVNEVKYKAAILEDFHQPSTRSAFFSKEGIN